MSFIWNEVFIRPLLNALIFFYNTIALQDTGLAIIYVTIFIRIILFPLFQKSARHQAVMQRLQPKLKELQIKYKDNRAKQTEETLALYREAEINPFAGFLFLLIQIPVLIALYRVFFQIFGEHALTGLYAFITSPPSLNPLFLGLLNLKNRSMVMVGIAAVAQYIQGRMMIPRPGGDDTAERMARQMSFLAPALTLAVLFRLPAAISLYWTVSALFSIGQQAIINRAIQADVDRNSKKNN